MGRDASSNLSLAPTGFRRTHLGPEAELRLRQLGFSSPEVVRDALQHGRASARQAMTPMHPASYAGTRMWGETTFALAAMGRTAGWDHETFRGVDLVTHHGAGVAIIVTAGDAATGHAEYWPQVRYERRDIITGLVNGELDTLWDAERGRSDWDMWFLLHYLGNGEDDVSAELSLPTGVDRSGRVTGWVERVVVPASRGGTGDLVANVRPEGAPEPVVSVHRRAAS